MEMIFRSYLYIDDAIAHTYQLGKNNKIKNQIINVGSNKSHSSYEIVKIINTLLKIKSKIIKEKEE